MTTTFGETLKVGIRKVTRDVIASTLLIIICSHHPMKPPTESFNNSKHLRPRGGVDGLCDEFPEEDNACGAKPQRISPTACQAVTSVLSYLQIHPQLPLL
jgi:hypothetical protein